MQQRNMDNILFKIFIVILLYNIVCAIIIKSRCPRSLRRMDCSKLSKLSLPGLPDQPKMPKSQSHIILYLLFLDFTLFCCVVCHFLDCDFSISQGTQNHNKTGANGKQSGVNGQQMLPGKQKHKAHSARHRRIKKGGIFPAMRTGKIPPLLLQ